jgi:predicted amidohydrolase
MRILVLLLGAIPAFAQQYDLLLKGGHVIDPKNNVDTVRDVAIKGGRITAVAPNIAASEAAKVIDVAGLYKDVVVGIKSAHWWAPNYISMERAVEAGKLTDVPVMVDFGYFLPERPYSRMVTEILRPGDMSTHYLRGPAPLVDPNGKPAEFLLQARKRGVKFDVGHGGGSFHFRLAAPLVKAGFYPDSLSTDMHIQSINAAMQDMPTTMSSSWRWACRSSKSCGHPL